MRSTMCEKHLFSFGAFRSSRFCEMKAFLITGEENVLEHIACFPLELSEQTRNFTSVRQVLSSTNFSCS